MVSLRCAGCGANLEVDPDVDHFTCGYCRTPQEVVRRGGMVILRKLGDAIARVQRGTDKTAAELAIPRLEREIEEVETRRARAIAGPVRAGPRTVFSNSILGLVCGAVLAFFGMIAMVGNGVTTGFAIHFVWALWIGCSIACVIGYLWLRVLRQRDRREAKVKRDEEIRTSSDAELAKLRDQLSRARAIVNDH